MKIEEIKYRDTLLARIIRQGKAEGEIEFFTPDDSLLQVGKHSREKGKIIKPHLHCSVTTQQNSALQEVLYIEKGKVLVKFYNPLGEIVTTKEISQGDLLLLIEGGHGFEFLEETLMIEIKQGPYNPESRRPLHVENE